MQKIALGALASRGGLLGTATSLLNRNKQAGVASSFDPTLAAGFACSGVASDGQ